MFRDMRRFKQQLTQEESEAILCRCTSGVLAVLGDGGYPYAVPLSYVYRDSKLYFHCATAGHKLDAVKREPKASFCVTDQDRIVPEKFTTYYRSVIVFGKVRILEDEEKRRAIELLAAKYSPGPELAEGRAWEIADSFPRLCVLELAAEHITGKQAVELVK